MTIELTKAKIGTIIPKKDLGEIGDVMEGDAEVICISYELYNRKSGIATKISFGCKDYDKLINNANRDEIKIKELEEKTK